MLMCFMLMVKPRLCCIMATWLLRQILLHNGQRKLPNVITVKRGRCKFLKMKVSFISISCETCSRALVLLVDAITCICILSAEIIVSALHITFLHAIDVPVTNYFSH